MSRIGKVSKQYLERIILDNLKVNHPEMLHGPQYGVDVGVVNIDKGRVMVTTTDPLSIIPRLGLAESAWLSVHLLASDIATSGFAPKYASLEFNLPPNMEDQEFEVYWKVITKEFEKLRIGIISGHTGRYQGCGYTVIGGGTMMGFGDMDKYLTTSMAEIGNSIVITKGAAIETTGILSRVFPEIVSEKLGESILEKGQRLLYQCSTVEDALTASSIGVREEGITSMHDATEGGIFGGLIELATASGKGLKIEKELIPISEEAKEICSLFEIDPYNTISEGTLIITVDVEREFDLLKALKSKGIKSTTIGRILHPNDGIRYIESGEEKPLNYTNDESYWKAFWKALDNKCS